MKKKKDEPNLLKAPPSKVKTAEDMIEYVERTTIREECKVVLEPILHKKVRKYKEKKKYSTNEAYKNIRIDLHNNTLRTLNLTDKYFKNIRENEEFALINKNGEIDSQLNSSEEGEDDEKIVTQNEDRKITIPVIIRLKDIPKPMAPFEISYSNFEYKLKKHRMKITHPISFFIDSMYKYLEEYDPTQYEDFEVDEVFNLLLNYYNL